MDLQAEKLRLIRRITQLTDEKVIAEIKSLLEGKTAWWDKISAEEKAEIEEGIEEADRGELTSHAKVMARYQKWL